MIELTKPELKAIQEIENIYYLEPALKLIKLKILAFTEKEISQAWRAMFDDLHEIMNETKSSVDLILNKRLEDNQISDINQARKSIAGNGFAKLVEYLFLKNKQVGNIKPNIFITSKPKAINIPEVNNLITIQVDNETQKPDLDLLIYSLKNEKEINKCLILSLKTSLRERAGQTYKWKLLLEIATSDNEIREKYGIKYNAKSLPLVGFVTINFYNEINNPQHRGMFKFFDRSFIGKPGYTDSDFVQSLSYIVDYVNSAL